MVKMSMLFFWAVISCGLIGRYQCFKETFVSAYKSAWKMEVWCTSLKHWYLSTSHIASQSRLSLTAILSVHFCVTWSVDLKPLLWGDSISCL
jgi:hypothetical protein